MVCCVLRIRGQVDRGLRVLSFSSGRRSVRGLCGEIGRMWIESGEGRYSGSGERMGGRRLLELEVRSEASPIGKAAYDYLQKPLVAMRLVVS